ncbi:MAG: VCBS repeat-containing protein [Flavobacteriaceae bacterium]|nr:VCBS repeat-containing protein [Flavobacteriaceae bacterium]
MFSKMSFQSILLYLFTTVLIFSCKNDEKPENIIVPLEEAIPRKEAVADKNGAELFTVYCSICHITPSIQDLPKNIWEKNVLPEMGARLGIRTKGYTPFMEANVRISGVYPTKPLIEKAVWDKITEYVVSNAPDSLKFDTQTLNSTQELTQFSENPFKLHKRSDKSMLITYFRYETQDNSLIIGNMNGDVISHNYKDDQTRYLKKVKTAVTAYKKVSGKQYLIEIGKLNPSEQVIGKLYTVEKDGNLSQMGDLLHRPVDLLAEDLDGDGEIEYIISEFGHLTGELSMLKRDKKSRQWVKTTLVNLPGAIRILSEDMNDDGKKDLVVLFAQGNESIFILYQKDDLRFGQEQVIRLSPVYGSSWFELVDYNGDGHKDIIMANGDNADYSVIPKPYHGVRIFINDGQNHFSQKYFHPINGATRLIAKDFDQDKDIDIAVIASFGDFENYPEQSFVYLENTNSGKFEFKPYTFSGVTSGSWMLMDSGDFDQDGDEDIFLTPLTLSFRQIPKESVKKWEESGADIMILENQLVSKKKVVN